MDEKETVQHDEEQLEHLEEEITEARNHLKEQTHQNERYLFEDDQDVPEAPGNNNPPA